MQGLMMNRPLLISSIAEHAEKFHGEREIVAVTASEPRHRTTWGEVVRRARRVAAALERHGLERGDRVATLAWNDHRHLELYYGISGAGYVCHTVNPRLFPAQIVYIVNHAEDRWLFVDPLFLPLLGKIAPELPTIEQVIVLTDDAHMPPTALPGVRSYESLIAGEPDTWEWPDFDERTASALCYTSGTTGHPKGVLYDHRSTILHAYAGVAADVLGLSSRDSVLPVVPLFHVNAWGTPYSAAIAGAKLVLPGPKMADGEVLYDLLESEEVSLALGVPTVWMALLQYLAASGRQLTKLKRTVIGGAAVPRSMIAAFRDRHGVEVRQGWGMTEMSPIGAVNSPKAGMEELDDEQKLDIAVKAGRGVYGCEFRIVGDDGHVLPWDGKAYGALQVRGNWVCSAYYRADGGEEGVDGRSPAHTADGWFDTGDVAIIDRQGYVTITDRTKDVIKSGGEWISSIELENVIMGHPAVAEAAVIGVPHPRWSERPLLVVVPARDAAIDKADLLAWYAGRVADWWIPNDVVVVEELPHTATGKVKKVALRERFADFKLPD
ncbi:MAG TPA: long-chain-fatty-acid--CoA ligase [Woeseiaceae bacterium]|nr:long-chain-fatty-acid--CoA ligase [Woeseiaceae bacterium]